MHRRRRGPGRIGMQRRQPGRGAARPSVARGREARHGRDRGGDRRVRRNQQTAEAVAMESPRAASTAPSDMADAQHERPEEPFLRLERGAAFAACTRAARKAAAPGSQPTIASNWRRRSAVTPSGSCRHPRRWRRLMRKTCAGGRRGDRDERRGNRQRRAPSDDSETEQRIPPEVGRGDRSERLAEIGAGGDPRHRPEPGERGDRRRHDVNRGFRVEQQRRARPARVLRDGLSRPRQLEPHLGIIHQHAGHLDEHGRRHDGERGRPRGAPRLPPCERQHQGRHEWHEIARSVGAAAHPVADPRVEQKRRQERRHEEQRRRLDRAARAAARPAPDSSSDGAVEKDR